MRSRCARRGRGARDGLTVRALGAGVSPRFQRAQYHLLVTGGRPGQADRRSHQRQEAQSKASFIACSEDSGRGWRRSASVCVVSRRPGRGGRRPRLRSRFPRLGVQNRKPAGDGVHTSKRGSPAARPHASAARARLQRVGGARRLRRRGPTGRERRGPTGRERRGRGATAGPGARFRGRHPQDPPRGDDRPGEPLVRLVLRHVSGRRRDSRQRRALHGLPARPRNRRL